MRTLSSDAHHKLYSPFKLVNVSAFCPTALTEANSIGAPWASFITPNTRVRLWAYTLVAAIANSNSSHTLFNILLYCLFEAI